MSFKKYQRRIAMESLENVDVPVIVDEEFTEDNEPDTSTDTSTDTSAEQTEVETQTTDTGDAAGAIDNIETTLQTVADENAGLDNSVAATATETSVNTTAVDDVVVDQTGTGTDGEIGSVTDVADSTDQTTDPDLQPATDTTTVVTVPVTPTPVPAPAQTAPAAAPAAVEPPPVVTPPAATPVAAGPIANASPVDAAVQAAAQAASTAPAGSEIKVSVTQAPDGTVTAHVEIESDDDDEDDVPDELPEDEIAENVDQEIAEAAEETEETEVAMESLRLQALALRRVAALESAPPEAIQALTQNIELQYRAMGLNPTKVAMEAYQVMSEPAMESFFSRVGDTMVVAYKSEWGDLINLFQTRKAIAAKYMALSTRVEAEFNSVKGGLKDIELKISDTAFYRHYITKKGSVIDPVAANRKESTMINYVLGTYVEACIKQAETAVAALKAGNWEKFPQVLAKLETLKTPIELFNRSLYNESFMARSSFSEESGRQRSTLLLNDKAYDKLAKLASPNRVSFGSDWRMKASRLVSSDAATLIAGGNSGILTSFKLRTGDAAALLKINKEIVGSLEKFASLSGRVQLVKKALEDLARVYVGGTGDQKALLKQAMAVVRVSLNGGISLGSVVSKQASQDLRYSSYLVQRIIYAAKANAKPTDPNLK